MGILEYKDGKLSGIPRVAVARFLVIHFRNKYDGLTDTSGEDPGKDLKSLRMICDVQTDVRVIQFPPQSMVDFKRYKFMRELVIVSLKFERGKLPRGITN